MNFGFSLGLSSVGVGTPAEPPIITAVVTPTLADGVVFAGETAEDAPNFSTFASFTNYASTAGDVESGDVVATEIINGTPSSPGTTDTVLQENDTLAIQFSVTDSVATTPRVFTTPTRTILADVTPPDVTELAYDIGENQITLLTDEGGTAFYLTNDSAMPLAGSVIEAAVVATTPDAFGTFAVTVGANDETPDFSGLAAGTHYIHFTVKDAAGNYSSDDVASFIWPE